MDDAVISESESQAMPARPVLALEPFTDSRALQTTQIQTIIGPSVKFVPPGPDVPLVLLDGQRALLILHMFSGRRRKQDVHWWLVRLATQILPDVQVRVISVDTAVDPILGDLSPGSNFQSLLSLARRGAFGASLTGPSAARHLPVADDDHGPRPRPLRSSAEPWGLAALRCSEIRQVHVGSVLMLNSWSVETAVILAGGLSTMEHPAPNDDPLKASVWRMSSHAQLLMSLPFAQQHVIEQWRYGSAGIKPTTLRTINHGPFDRVERTLRDTQLPAAIRPRQVLAGIDPLTGQYRTAATAVLCFGYLDFDVSSTAAPRPRFQDFHRFCC